MDISEEFDVKRKVILKNLSFVTIGIFKAKRLGFKKLPLMVVMI